jgi:non-heme chloroperoxidase
MSFGPDMMKTFRSMMASRELTRTVMATAASSLFVPDREPPQFRDGVSEAQKRMFERILEQAFGVSEGVWIGTPINLTLERASGELARKMPDIDHPHLVLWGEQDGWIAEPDLETMAASMPDCRLVRIPGLGHSMNLELPALYAGYFGAWFGGVEGR